MNSYNRDVECLSGMFLAIVLSSAYGAFNAFWILACFIFVFAFFDWIIVQIAKRKAKPKNTLQRLHLEMADQSYFKKLWADARMMSFFINCTVRSIIFKAPKNIEAKNDAISQVKEDIEFGYSFDMIYQKILSGSYGNDPYDEKDDWFKQNKKEDESKPESN